MFISESSYSCLAYTHLTVAIVTGRVAQWIAQFPLATIQRIIHLCFPESEAWEFAHGLKDTDADLFQYFEWRNPRSDSPGADMVVAVQPPWVLSSQDLRSFTEISSVRKILTLMKDVLLNGRGY